MTLGITVGKFYPFHAGHQLLVETAKAQVDHLVVLIGYKPTQQIPVEIRANWIRELHPDVEVIEVLEDIPESPEPWAQRALAVLNHRQPDFAFTSESYGACWAELMGAQHVSVDVARRRRTISGTKLREDISTYWSFLTPPAKAYFAKRISIVGVESSGTTTLAQALAEHYQTVWVPEYGRSYWEGRRFTPNQESWDTTEFLRIARSQSQWEDDLARLANLLVVCDTDPLATHVWHRRFLDRESAQLGESVAECSYDLTILTTPDFGFVQDGTREGEHIRHEMHEWFQHTLHRYGRRFVTVAGSHDERLKTAIEHIAPMLRFSPLSAP